MTLITKGAIAAAKAINAADTELAQADHATWVSFSKEEVDDLAMLLRLASVQPLLADVGNRLMAKVKQYVSADTKFPEFRAAAEKADIVRDGELEIDDHGVVSASENGAYVMAWVWVPNELYPDRFTADFADEIGKDFVD